MRSKVYIGETGHCRFQPQRHAFTYPLYFLALDLTELEMLQKTIKGFRHNRWGVISIWDSDYLSKSGSILARVQEVLHAHGAPHAARISLLTMPRVCGYVFNPVNFYLCYESGGTLTTIIAEVNNTFDESHLYVVNRSKDDSLESFTTTFPKELFVSPFLAREGNYSLSCSEVGDQIEIQVHIDHGGSRVFSSSLTGKGKPLTTWSLYETLLRFPFSAWTTMSRIIIQALQLRFIKGVQFVEKPILGVTSFRRKGYIGVSARARARVVDFLQNHRTRCDRQPISKEEV